jgi:hypothetical protein
MPARWRDDPAQATIHSSTSESLYELTIRVGKGHLPQVAIAVELERIAHLTKSGRQPVASIEPVPPRSRTVVIGASYLTWYSLLRPEDTPPKPI